MSKSRWGGFRAGRLRYTSQWTSLRTPAAAAQSIPAPTSPTNFDYTTAQGIWNLTSTVNFRSTESTILYDFDSFTFTNGTQTGRTGPSLANLLSAYNTSINPWLSNSDYFDENGGIQLWTVPSTGMYTIDAYGAQGGKAGSSSGQGGLGARIQGTFSLTAGDKLRIVVGQAAGFSTGQSGGGGGGSYVLKETGFTTDDILIIAGGGGGGQRTSSGSGGSSATSSTGVNLASVGSGGNNDTTSGGAGGAGWNGNGADGQGGVNSGGKSPANGFTGGTAGTCAASGAGTNDVGGFGGGGGGEWCSRGSAGGGGGYTGGSGSNTNPAGGGGGSYNNGSDQINTANFKSGNGQVIITKI